MRKLIALAVMLLAVGTVWANEPINEREMLSLFASDLGPDTIDVSKYSQKQKDNYKIFVNSCSKCHTLARAINSPTTNNIVWDYYVTRMRLRSKFEPGTEYTAKEAAAILDFLAYDSKQRKEKNRVEFEELYRNLERRFSRTISERMERLQKNAPPITPSR